MRKIVYGVSFIALFGLTIVGCQKEQFAPTDGFSNSKLESNNSNTVSNQRSTLRVWHDNGDDNFGCYSTGGNCFDDYIVTAKAKSIFNDIFDVLHSNDDAIKNVLNKQQGFLRNTLAKKFLTLQ